MPLNREAIVERRKALVLTQSECARLMGYTVQRWNQVETGKRLNLKLDELETMAAVLQCSVIDLITPSSGRQECAVMLAKKFDAAEHDVSDWLISEKYDGVRARWTGSQLVTRTNKPINAPAWFTRALPPVELDGELWMGRNRLEQVAGCVSCDVPDERWQDVRFVVFDAPQGGTYAKRLAYLHTLTLPAHVEIAEQAHCRDGAHLMQRMAAIVDAGGEGLIVRDPHAFYVRGRSDRMLKVKPRDDAEATVEAVNDASVNVVTDDGVKFALSTSTLKASPCVGDRITFQFTSRTKRKVPRCPVALRIRRED